MGPPPYMRSVVDRYVVMQPMPVYSSLWLIIYQLVNSSNILNQLTASIFKVH